MDTTLARQILAQKDPPNLYEAVAPAIADAKFREVLLEGLTAKDESYRYNCARALHRVVEERPDLIYPYWDRLVSQLDSPNGFHRASALWAIAGLTVADQQGKFERILGHYLNLFDDQSVMVARYFTQSIAGVIRAKPALKDQIIARLLEVDSTHHAQGRKDLIKADLIAVFDELFDQLQEKERILEFVEAQLESNSPKARKAAKDFLKKHPKG
jgi:hypothetical protein